MISDPQESLREEVEARQRNTQPHDQLRNGVGVDALLWKGDPNATKLQRAGIAMFGSFFLAAAVAFLGMAWEANSILLGVVSVAFLLVSIRLFRNVFRREIGRVS
jgi:hypothetical protein